ncbi:MAG: alpha/beta fold hydrolase [Pseudomonadota bacterium]
MDGDIRLAPKEERQADAANDEAASGPRKLSEIFDERLRQAIVRRSNGVSNISLFTAYTDWMAHMAVSPATSVEVMGRAGKIGLGFWASLMSGAASPTRAGEQDAPARYAPVRAWRQTIEAYDDLVDEVVDSAAGASKRNRDLMRFALRQQLQFYRPENYLLTNEEALSRAYETRGASLYRGWMNWVKDAGRIAVSQGESTRDETSLKVGVDLAATPGDVVYRNELIELIQYKPSAEKVRAEPILITPAWIMKYYILDLSPRNSMVKYLTEQGFTVYVISWRNPGANDAELSFDDYRKLGVEAAIDAATDVSGAKKIHTVGYCLGGTLLAIAAAALARRGDDRLASLTLLAAQTDFRDPGELSVYIDEDQLHWLETAMKSNGVLKGEQMGWAFQMLRSKDLVWRRMQRAYFLGERDPEFDLSVWNEDVTRMPFRMHSEYLRRLFLDNDFVQGRFIVDGAPVAVSDIRAPIFALGTEKDHVAPWRSVFKIHLFADVEVTFALTTGGHNAGVVSEPGKPRRSHRVLSKADYDHYVSPDDWLEHAERVEGSWWPTWTAWLAERSSQDLIAPPEARPATVAGNLIKESDGCDAAPGDYVFG